MNKLNYYVVQREIKKICCVSLNRENTQSKPDPLRIGQYQNSKEIISIMYRTLRKS